MAVQVSSCRVLQHAATASAACCNSIGSLLRRCRQPAATVSAACCGRGASARKTVWLVYIAEHLVAQCEAALTRVECRRSHAVVPYLQTTTRSARQWRARTRPPACSDLGRTRAAMAARATSTTSLITSKAKTAGRVPTPPVRAAAPPRTTPQTTRESAPPPVASPTDSVRACPARSAAFERLLHASEAELPASC